MDPSDHQDPAIRSALRELVRQGWILRKEGHWGRLYCPCRDGGCTAIPVAGTPKNPGQEAKRIRRLAARCPLPPDDPRRSLAGTKRGLHVDDRDVHVEEGDVMEYGFTFVVGGVDVNDASIVSVLMEQLDATLARAGGVDLLVMSADGSDAIDAARNAALSVKFHVPQLQILRLDRDLVGISEIAERTGRSRQNVAQWVTGERRADIAQPFPPPEAVVGRARVWLWTEVNAWLRHLRLEDEEALPSRAEINDIDYMLRHNLLLPLNRPQARLGWPVGYVAQPPQPGTDLNERLASAPARLSALLLWYPAHACEVIRVDLATQTVTTQEAYSLTPTPTFVTTEVSE